MCRSDPIPNLFYEVSGHVSSSYPAGSASTLRRPAVQQESAPTGSDSTNPLIWRIGLPSLRCIWTMFRSALRNSGRRSRYERRSGGWQKRFGKRKPRSLKTWISSTALPPRQIYLPSWFWIIWSKLGTPPLRLEQHSLPLSAMRSICSPANCDFGFAHAKTPTAV